MKKGILLKLFLTKLKEQQYINYKADLNNKVLVSRVRKLVHTKSCEVQISRVNSFHLLIINFCFHKAVRSQK